MIAETIWTEIVKGGIQREIERQRLHRHHAWLCVIHMGFCLLVWWWNLSLDSPLLMNCLMQLSDDMNKVAGKIAWSVRRNEVLKPLFAHGPKDIMKSLEVGLQYHCFCGTLGLRLCNEFV